MYIFQVSDLRDFVNTTWIFLWILVIDSVSIIDIVCEVRFLELVKDGEHTRTKDVWDLV